MKRWFGFARSTPQWLLNFFISRYRKLQPTPLEVGIILMVVMFPTGVWLNQKTDSTSQYLADYANGFFMLGLGLVLAYLYIDRFNERAKRQEYREVNGALVEAAYNVVNGIFVYLFGMLLKVPEDTLEDTIKNQVGDLILAYAAFLHNYFDDDRLEILEHFKGEFDAILREKA